MEPFALALGDGSVVLKETLDKFALKSDEFEFDKDMFDKKVSKKDIATKANPGEESKQLREGQNTYSFYNLMRPPYPPKMLTSLKEINTYHSSAVKTKAVDTAGLGVKIVPIGDNPNPENKKILEQFLQNCDPTPEDLFTRACQDEEEVGWLAIEVIRTAGEVLAEPQRLEHIPSHTIRIHKDGNRFMHTWDGINRRWFKLIGDYRSVKDQMDKDIDNTDGSEKEFNSLPKEKRANELIYDINYSSGTSYYGTPDSIPAIRTMLGDQAASNYNLSFFKNFATPQYAVYITGNFKDQPILDDLGNPTGKSVLQKAIEDRFREVKGNPHGNMVFMIPSKGGADTQPVTITFEKLSVDIKDSHFRLYRDANRDEVVSAERVDPYRAMIVQKGNMGGGNTVSVQTAKNYKSTTIKPKQRRLEALINKYVIWRDKDKGGFGILDWAIKFEEIDTDDESHEMNMTQALFNMGTISPLQIADRFADRYGTVVPEELRKHPALNAYYINGNPLTLEPQNQEMPEEVAKILEDIADKLDPEQSQNHPLRRLFGG